MKTFVPLVVFLLGTAAAAVAQASETHLQDNMGIKAHLLHPIVESRVDIVDDPTAKEMGVSVGGGVEIRYKRSTSLLLGSVNKAWPKAPACGVFDVNSYYNFAKYGFAGGGLTAGKPSGNPFAKSSLHPYLGIGFGDNDLSATFNWIFPGTDRETRMKGARLDFSMSLSESDPRRWYLVGSTAFYSARCKGCSVSISPVVVSGGIRYRF